MIKKSAEVKSSRKNKKNEAGDWIGPNGENFGPKGKNTRAVVGTVEFPQYESIDEAVRELSAPTALKLLNTQVETNAKNAQRAEAVGSPSEKILQRAAFERLTSSPEGLEKLKNASQDQTRFDALIAETVAAIKAEQGIVETADEEEEETVPA